MGASFFETRSENWHQELLVKVRDLFAGVAQRHNLNFEFEENDPVDVSCVYPAQQGLSFELWMNLQNGDEIWFGGDDWSFSRFPADDPQNWDCIAKTLDGIITANARVIRYTALGRGSPFWTSTQLLDDGIWQTVSTRVGIPIPPIWKSDILLNIGNAASQTISLD